MRAFGAEIVHDAAASGNAIAAFSTYTLESTTAICRAAEKAGLPAIIQIGSGAYRETSLEALAAASLAAARSCAVPIGVHLDHSRSLEEILRCLELGFTSIMVDGSHLRFDENIALTRRVVEEVHAAGGWVEGEIGSVAGSEHSSLTATAGGLTDPDEAATFVRETGIDVLAAAVGTVHGFTADPVHVDVERIRDIARMTAVPFALHGASGVDDAELRGAISAGAAKINVNVELRRVYLVGLRQSLVGGGDDIVSLQGIVVGAIEEVALDRLLLFSRAEDGHVDQRHAR